MKPAYRARAQKSGTEGVVTLEGTIYTDGTISELRVLSREVTGSAGGTLTAPETLSEAAQNAVRQWQYVPAKLNGAPVALIVSVTVNFRLK